MATQDVLTAFDSMDHEYCLNAHARRGAGSGYVALLARELTGIEAAMQIDGAERCAPFPFEKGGKQ